MHKISKEMLNHLNEQCLLLTNTEKKYHLKETYFPWNTEEDIFVYLMKLHKEQERLKKPELTEVTHKQ